MPGQPPKSQLPQQAASDEGEPQQAEGAEQKKQESRYERTKRERKEFQAQREQWQTEFQAQRAALIVVLEAREVLDPAPFRAFVDYLAALVAGEAARCVNWESAGFDLDGPEDDLTVMVIKVK